MPRYYGETDEEFALAKRVERGYRMAAFAFFAWMLAFVALLGWLVDGLLS